MAHGMDAPGKYIRSDAPGDTEPNGMLARVFLQAAESATVLAQAPSTLADVVAAATDASTICRAASELTRNSSALGPDLARVAFGSLANLQKACAAQLRQTPACLATLHCLQCAEACQELYLQAYLRARGFACGRGLG
ncbi:MAG: hypothetical protein OXU20_24990 [Myxococcales bacterium]|nr:hypothetical protein [Myxococcales bacterium]